jgi:hypothetical protein
MTTANLTEDTALRLAPDDQVLRDGRELIRKGRFANLGISADGTWLLGACQGSGKQPYQVSVDLANPDQPTCRCNCPSRKFPCKHGMGLMLLYAQSPEKFAMREPDADLLAKREKQVARAAKAETAPPKKVNVAALNKKAKAQRDGLDVLEKLLLDLVASGQWFERSRLDRLERQARQMQDAYLPGATYMLNRLRTIVDDADRNDDSGSIGDEQLQIGAELIGQLWATVQKGRNYLDDKIAGDESASEAEAVVEDLLGRVWRLDELIAQGKTRSNLTLLELAYERIDDEARSQRIETSHLIDLKSGEILHAISMRPFKGMQHIPEQASYPIPLKVAVAAIYPGFINRRVRWEKNAEATEDLKPAHLKAVYAAARGDFKSILDEFRKQLKHPLAPRDAVFFIRCERLGLVGDALVFEDAAGQRIVAADRRPDYSNVANLARSAAVYAKSRPALLVRLFVRALTNDIVAEPLALVVPDKHLRLGI